MRHFTRRELLGVGMGAAGIFSGSLRAMPSSPACVLTSEQEEGPYYVDGGKVRRDITEGKPGIPLLLRVALVHAKRCTPLSNLALDIWHCDAEGIYSGFTKMSIGQGGPRPGGPPPPGFRPSGPAPDGFGPPPPGFGPPTGGRGPGGHHALDSQRFLRGVQSANYEGLVEFATIYPGWYQGRAVHIHLKVHSADHVCHTGQLFFPEEITAQIAQLPPYRNHKEVHLTSLQEDDIFQHEHGAVGLLKLERLEARSNAAGFVASVTLAVDPEATPQPVGMRGPMPPSA